MRAVLQNPLAAFERQIQSIEVRVLLFELIDHPKRLQVVLEPAIVRHALIESILACMAEGRVSQVVRQAYGFG